MINTKTLFLSSFKVVSSKPLTEGSARAKPEPWKEDKAGEEGEGTRLAYKACDEFPLVLKIKKLCFL